MPAGANKITSTMINKQIAVLNTAYAGRDPDPYPGAVATRYSFTLARKPPEYAPRSSRHHPPPGCTVAALP